MRKPKRCNGSSCADCEPAGCAFCQPITSDEKVKSIEQQIRAVELGASNSIVCPYCQVVNQEGRPLCCRLFAVAAIAVMGRKDVNARLELASEIAERAARC